MIKFASEGYPFILGSIILAAVVFLFSPAGSVPVFCLAGFMCYFFRDPERLVPEGKGFFVTPADGRIIVIREVRETRYLNADVVQISIFMSPLNVHVNRAPCDGRVKKVVHNKGRFLAAYKDEASLRNENIEMVLETAYGDILVRQVAGFVARRAVCRKKEGDVLLCGERYGMIKFSSRLDVYLPKGSEIKVKMDEKVRAGESVLAKAV